MVEGDEEGPIITVLSPSENSQFYVLGGEDTPDSIFIHATATDESGISQATISIFNSEGDEVINPYSVYATSFNSYQVNHIQRGFSTLIPGIYRIEIEYRDDLEKSSIVTRNVLCLASGTGGNDY